MGNPAVVKQIGTGTIVWIPDWLQSPFQIGIAAVTSGAQGTFTVDASWDDVNVVDVNGVAAPTWWNVVPIGSANASANFTTPVQAFRVFMQTAVATSMVAVSFVQATFGR